MSIEVRCTDPYRRDALEEAARLTLSFVAVGSRPDFNFAWRNGGLRLVLSTHALEDGCYLPEAAQQLLEAVQAFGVPVVRLARGGDKPCPEEWLPWWSKLPQESEGDFNLILPIM